jgi:tetratricopeptide (TPR) repeat protein
MRHLTRVSIIAGLACLSLFAQGELPTQLKQALVLEQQGQFDTAITVISRLLDSGQLTRAEVGRADIMLGFAYRAAGNLAAAQNSFEVSLSIFRRDRQHPDDYASALDNFAGLYGDLGKLGRSGTMLRKALGLRQQIGDRAGAVRSLLNLAGLSMAQKRLRQANEYLERASAEMKIASGLVDDDYALFFETQGYVAMAGGQASAAIAWFQRALDQSQENRGYRHWLTGWELMLRGKAYAQSGDLDRALEDMQKGLAILDHALGRKNPKYLVAQMAYSEVLDRAGAHVQAAQLRASTNQAVRDFYRGQCLGCTINVAGFR